MTKLKQLFITLAVALGLLVPAAVATSAPSAAALHANTCTLWQGTSFTSVFCTAVDSSPGQGIYRGVVECHLNGATYTYYGPWRNITATSTARCVQGTASAGVSFDHWVDKA